MLVPCQCIVFVKSKLKFSGQFVVCLWLDSVSSFSIFFSDLSENLCSYYIFLN